jgi:NHLM bacteriocin system ABC transporter peptidase/ATP-binding protein
VNASAGEAAGAAWPAPNLPRRGGRRRTPLVLQMEATECGAVALAMVLGHHGRFVPLAEMREACGVSRDGSKASGILRAARHYGLEGKGFRRDAAGLAALPFPMILFWNANHFVVLEGFSPAGGGRYLLNDPATGPCSVPRAEFEASYSGICLVFRPGPGFGRAAAPRRVAGLLGGRLRPVRGAFLAVCLVAVAAILPGLLLPAFAKVFVDRVLLGGFEDWVRPLLLGMALTALFRGVLAWMEQALLARIAAQVALAHAAAFVWHLLRLPAGFFAQRRVGDLALRVHANERVAALLAGDLAASLVGLLGMAVFLAAMLALQPVLALVVLAGAAVNLLALAAAARRQDEGSRRLLKQEALLRATTAAGIQLIEPLKASGQEADFFARWAGAQAAHLDARQRLDALGAAVGLVPALVAALVAAAVIGLGGWLVLAGQITVGGIVAFQSLAASFLAPTQRLVRLGGDLQRIRGDVARIDDVLAEAPAAALAGTGAVLGGEADAEGRPQGALELRRVTFGYHRQEPPLLEEVSLVIRPGSRVALVGGSGSGKSTLGRLITGLEAPWSGEVLLDGRPLASLGHQRRAAALAAVDQEVVLFEGTVRENVALWDPTLPERSLVRALADAAILDVVQARPGGLDARLAENGADLSGGQRQRLEIARALAGDPAVLVLDEATSALDPLTELAIDRALRRRGCTCVIIAHRLSTIRDCDEIVVLDRGRVVERGTHEALLAAGGAYARLIHAE